MIFLLTISVANSSVLKGGVSFTVEQARQNAFQKISLKIDMKDYSEFFIDKNYRKNIALLVKNKNKYRDRYLMKFSDGTYGISYIKNLRVIYYYDPKGQLYALDICTSESYPRKSFKYNIDGELEGVSFDVSSEERFIFDINKKLVAHWIGNNGYDENGELFMTRK